MGLFKPSAATTQRQQQRTEEAKAKYEARQKEEEALEARLRGKSLKDQFNILSKRSDFWKMVFIILFCIFAILAKWLIF